MAKSNLLSVNKADDIFSERERKIAARAYVLITELLDTEPKNYISQRYGGGK